MVYDLTEHPLLDAEAKKLQASEDAFTEQTALAAHLLGVQDSTFAGEDLVRIRRALVLQLNFQLKIKPEMFLKLQESSSASKQNVTYRAAIGLVSPFAATIVNGLVRQEDLWEDLRSVRRNFA